MIIKMSKSMFELYVKTKLDLSAEDRRAFSAHATDDNNILDILSPSYTDLNTPLITETISSLVASYVKGR